MRKTITKLDNYYTVKQEEFYSLQSKKRDLIENMSNPDAIEDANFDIEENKRQTEQISRAKLYAVNNDKPDTKEVFNVLIDIQNSVIESEKRRGLDTTESVKILNSILIIQEDIEAFVDDSQNSDQDEDNESKGPPSDDSASMDISSSDGE